MCDSCGCGDHDIVPVDVHERILAGNDRAARHNREHFHDHGVAVINLMGSPGAGKTAVLEATARLLGPSRPLGVLVGDLATDNDARRVRAAGIVAEAITTGSACHLDAAMVHQGLHRLPSWRDLDMLFIENVGNLVCPAVYDLGQDVNVVALSVTEGEDKPLKYPIIFRKADLVLLTKVDLLAVLPDISIARVLENLSMVMPKPAMIPVSAATGQGVDQWVQWLAGLRLAGQVSAGVARGHSHGHGHDHRHDQSHDHHRDDHRDDDGRA
ncbi:MAG TPA: hydrogenase nickel incorporation protein HypB [Vicinamibacterales bacterium]|nr:hydrogenase nickel incorporation protein HypB [Vicinamibacterales bacterium]